MRSLLQERAQVTSELRNIQSGWHGRQGSLNGSYDQIMKISSECCMAEVLRGVSSREGESDAPLYCISVWLTIFTEDVVDQTFCNTVIVNGICGSGADVCILHIDFERLIQAELDQQDPKGKNGFVAYDIAVMRRNTKLARRLWAQGTALGHGDASPCEG